VTVVYITEEPPLGNELHVDFMMRIMALHPLEFVVSTRNE